MESSEKEEILKKATGDMVQSLNAFGHDEVLRLLVLFSNQDEILAKLLLKFPSIVSTSRFLCGKPIINVQMNKERFQDLMNTGCPVWVREQKGPEEEGHIQEKAPRKPKRTTNRKQNLDQPKQPSAPTKHKEKNLKEFKGEDSEKIIDSLPEIAEEVTDEMGRALTEMGHYKEAMMVLQKGLQKYPKSCSLWVTMGGLYDALGNYSESLQCFKIALQFASETDYKSVCYDQAVALVNLRRYSDAASILEFLTKQYPENPKYLAEMGCCLREMGYPHEAIRNLQKAMGLFKKFPSVSVGVTIFSALCSAYMDLAMKEEAVEISLDGLKRFPNEDSVLYHNAGAAFLAMGWVNQCIEILKKGVHKFPDDSELKEFLKNVENDLDNDPPDGGELLSLLLIAVAISAHKKLKKKP